MAITRHATGSSTPRVPFTPTTAAPPSTTTKTKLKTKTTTTKKSTTPKANISKPRAKKTETGRVEKQKKAATAGEGKKNVRKAGLGDKATGAVEKVVGTVEEKPGKKGAGTKKIKETEGRGATRVKK